jgi:chromosome segregation ATPase
MDDLKDTLDKVEGTLDEHTKMLNSIDKTLALQAQQLAQHIKRTDLAEENINMLRSELKPVKAHVDFINGLSKLITLVCVIIGAVAGLIEAVKYFTH